MAEPFVHVRHAHVKARRVLGPPKHAHAASSLSDRIGMRITAAVGTMACAAIFTVLAVVALPGALKTGDPVIIIAWISQAFLQLVLLSIIMVGGNVSAKASDARADATYRDAESVLAECLELQRHLQHQDGRLDAQDQVLSTLVAALTKGKPK